jgi:hypothetical protein
MNKLWSLYLDVILYIIIIFISTSIIGYNETLFYFLIFTTYIFASRTFFLITFVPKVFELIKYLMINDDVLFSLKYRENEQFEVKFLFQTYLNYQRDKSGFNKKMVRFSYWSFAFMPILIYAYIKLNKIKTHR